MLKEILFISCIISFFVGAKIGMKLLHKPIVIEFKISHFNSFMYAFSMFFLITTIMILELLLTQYLFLYWNIVDWKWNILHCALDGGVLVAIALPILSKTFGKWAMACNLDLCAEYDINVIKLYYSLAIIANCVWLLFIFGSSIIGGEEEAQRVLSRIIIWTLSVVGTWWGIGFGCEGRISEELKNIKISKVKKSKEETWKYSIPFVGGFLVNCFLLLIQAKNIEWIKNIFLDIYIVFLFGGIGMIFWIFKEQPSPRRSNRKLAKAIGKVTAAKIVRERYQTIQYSLVEKDEEKYVLIHEQNVVWKGHELEIKERFGEQSIPVKVFDYQDCKKLLEQLVKDRRTFIQDGNVCCQENVRTKLIEQSLS